MLNNLTDQDLFILGCLLVLIALVGIVCLVMALFTKNENKKKKSKNKVEHKEIDMSVSLATNDIPEISKEAPNINELLNSVKEEKNIDKVDEEVLVDDLIEDQVEVQENKKSSSIEDVLRLMNADLEKQKYENIDKYEEEQEENAVISYQELLDRKMALNNEYKEEVKKVEENIEEKPKTTKFSNSEFISPIFGRVNKTNNNEEIIKDTEEDNNDDDFLNNLKQFRNNL